VVDEPRGVLPAATRRIPVPAADSGTVRVLSARQLGLAAVLLGAGRRRVEDTIDPAAGIELAAQVGERVERGEPVAYLLSTRASDDDLAAAREMVSGAFQFGAQMSAPQSALVLEVLR
jgi:thymidine phosphorylase